MYVLSWENRLGESVKPLMLDFRWVGYDGMTACQFAERSFPMNRMIAFAFPGLMLVAGTATAITIKNEAGQGLRRADC